MTVTARRLRNEPIIHEAMNPRLGTNFSGPSLIRVPDWVENPLGRYYLYFAHHKGTFIRMAYADFIEGPWTVHDPGVLDVTESLFVTEDLPDQGQPTNDWTAKTGGTFLYAHVASPDVHIDHAAQTIRMYYHGLLPDADQQTRLATSVDGLSFVPKAPLLGPPYFRVFAHRSYVYAIAWGGELFRAPSWGGPFERRATPLPASPNTTIRHVAVLCRGNRLDLFATRIGDQPESILHSVIDLSGDWNDWTPSAPECVLLPERDWEGGSLPYSVSKIGASEAPEHALRDPCIYVEGERVFLLYTGAGEANIGLAELNGI